MKIMNTGFPDVKLLEPAVFEDQRGYFYESFNHKKFEDLIGRKINFVQDNHSVSNKGVLRGLHYQIGCPQGKLVRCTHGEILDVVVDVRKSSNYFGRSMCAKLSQENNRQIWIPEGFAHGFLVLSETAEVLYKTTDYYSPVNERSIVWNDADLNIDWQSVSDPIISEKDQNASSFALAEYL